MKRLHSLEKDNVSNRCDGIDDHDQPDNTFCDLSFDDQANNKEEKTKHERRKEIIHDYVITVN